jgi:deazaflavin-dependent oxidoreductase (nitroreductase family)
VSKFRAAPSRWPGAVPWNEGAEIARTMDEAVRVALARDRTIDITTTGRRSGRPVRIEMWYHLIDGTVYLTGTPGARDWYANLLAHPEFTFHLKDSTTADLPARATPVTDEAQRRAVFERLFPAIGRPTTQLDEWVARSPLVVVDLVDPPA